MTTAKQNLLQAYDSHIDEVFSYFYNKTADRNTAKTLSQKVFTDVWDHISGGNQFSTIDALVDQFKASA